MLRLASRQVRDDSNLERISILFRIYRFIRNTAILNYLIHKILYFLENFVLYEVLYRKYIEYRAKQAAPNPAQLVFMVTNLCNANCIMCPHKKFREMNYDAVKIMPMELYKKTLRDAKDFVKQIIFTGGEPLLDPNIFERIWYAKGIAPQATLLFFTNGTLLHKNNNIQKLLQSPLDSITVSLDATTREDYENVRLQLSYQQLINNVKNLYSKKCQSGAKQLIRFSILALKANEKSHQVFFKEMKDFADVLELNNPHNFAGLVDVEVKYAYISKKRFPCYYLWSRMTIPPDGMISICGYDFVKGHIVGSLYDKTVMEIWNAETFKSVRDFHLQGKYDNIKMCKKCTAHVVWWKSFRI